MSDKYRPAPEVQAIAADLIRQHHGHLISNGVRVVCLFVDKAPKVRGKEALGVCRKIDGLAAFLRDFDPETGEVGDGDAFFVIEIWQEAWDRKLMENERVALVDHELSHAWCEEDEHGAVKLSLLGHDLEEFRAVVERHGLWQPDLRAMARSFEPHMAQMSLDLPGLKERAA